MVAALDDQTRAITAQAIALLTAAKIQADATLAAAALLAAATEHQAGALAVATAVLAASADTDVARDQVGNTAFHNRCNAVLAMIQNHIQALSTPPVHPG
jgi:hypothetical protein